MAALSVDTARISAAAGGLVYSCPVCGYQGLREPPRDFSICPSCGTEFESDDFGTTQEEVERRQAELRNEWSEKGAQWFSHATPRPQHWNPYAQLAAAGLSVRVANSVNVMIRIDRIGRINFTPSGAESTEASTQARLVHA